MTDAQAKTAALQSLRRRRDVARDTVHRFVVCNALAHSSMTPAWFIHQIESFLERNEFQVPACDIFWVKDSVNEDYYEAGPA